eukprot:2157313-Pleurochrysis_carterae.AAC.5
MSRVRTGMRDVDADVSDGGEAVCQLVRGSRRAIAAAPRRRLEPVNALVEGGCARGESTSTRRSDATTEHERDRVGRDHVLFTLREH